MLAWWHFATEDISVVLHATRSSEVARQAVGIVTVSREARGGSSWAGPRLSRKSRDGPVVRRDGGASRSVLFVQMDAGRE